VREYPERGEKSHIEEGNSAVTPGMTCETSEFTPYVTGGIKYVAALFQSRTAG